MQTFNHRAKYDTSGSYSKIPMSEWTGSERYSKMCENKKKGNMSKITKTDKDAILALRSEQLSLRDISGKIDSVKLSIGDFLKN